MLSKENCIKAINLWETTRTNFTKIRTLIAPSTVFNFSKDDCEWIKENNNNSNFHAYAGVYNDQFILISVPLDKNGLEIDLDSYLTTTLTDLKEDITLIETDVVTTVTKTTLSTNLEITKHWKEIDLPTYNAPTISERAAVNYIEKWKNECLDWFYYQCTSSSKGENIFRAFKIPFADLSRDDQKQDDVIALFGFKHSSIYQSLLPLLVFVTVVDQTNIAQIIRASNIQTELDTNTRDWARPCPPLCKDKTDFTLLYMDE
ncbi:MULTISPECIES: hypothetical protein [unclassified Olleya]|uniref:hypothetical protein n=1 Tax=unclassified Olleya TaxID=2615019 RepID=UPI000C300343|nr:MULTISPECIES: hypothetical protein [unclassified Olleya]AUC76400.1 hypothetical protein CW732_12280 [Olleya sp. Bg11-27]QXP58669.1 hypothetical protein H0I26_12175 [Olleya sp. HaHaR_3_96]